ncbi:MAG: alginate lyase family protein, partial [Aeriscardovia sp.]|nr:alginate lyase family protein [Aeriscardovia sp.]
TAKIGETGYADLAAALTAAMDGDIIELLADQEISSRVNIQNKAITIKGNYTIKRASSYKGIMFLTVAPAEGENAATLTLDGVTLDGQNVEATATMIEAGNKGTTILNNVTVKNETTTANAVIINKSGGKLTLNGVTFTDCSAAKGTVFDGNSVTLSGENTIPSIYIEKALVMTATGATSTAPIEIKVDEERAYGQVVEGGDATQFINSAYRLSQQMDGVYLMPKSVAVSFTHPTLLHTSADIEAVKERLTSDKLTQDAYARLETQSGGSAAGAVEVLKRLDANNWSETYSDYGNFSHAATDAKLAYELALRYQLKSSTAAATAAVNILNNWATTNKGMLRLKGYNNNIPDPNEYLMTIQAYQFANAAELLRSYEGWTAEDQTKFQNWIRQTFADVAIQFLENHHNNPNSQHYWLNWDLAALNALLSVGILCDDQALVDYALNYTTNGTGTGKAGECFAYVTTHQDADSEETLAQCQESGRDQGHSTLDITLLGVLCQTAHNIGTDLFTPYKALEMAEYVGKYNLKNAEGNFVYDNVTFNTYNNGEVEHTAISAEARGSERPCWELFHAYAKENGKSDIYTEAWVKYMRDKNAWGEAEGTSTDELGFGTLMFGAEVSTTGIQNVTLNEIENVTNENVFNLSGQRVEEGYKGIVIKNGRKYIVK